MGQVDELITGHGLQHLFRRAVGNTAEVGIVSDLRVINLELIVGGLTSAAEKSIWRDCLDFVWFFFCLLLVFCCCFLQSFIYLFFFFELLRCGIVCMLFFSFVFCFFVVVFEVVVWRILFFRLSFFLLF